MVQKKEPKERRERRVRCSICKRLFEKSAIQAHRDECEKQQRLEINDATQLELAPVIELRPNASPVFIPAPQAQSKMPEVIPHSELAVQESPRLPEARGVEGWPLLRGRLSASALSTFQKCPEQFRRKYILGIYGGKGGAAVAGTAAHHAIEVAARYKMRQGEVMSPAYVKQAAEMGFVHDRDDAPSIDWGKDSEKDWLGRAQSAAMRYVSNVLPLLDVRGAEELFLTHVAGIPVPIVGYIDLVTPQASIDVKTGAKIHNKIDAGWRIQGHIYLLADRAMSWHSVRWDGEYRTPMDANLEMPLTAANYKIGLELVRNTVEAIIAFAERFGPDHYWPGALGHGYACNYCDFKENGCAWWHPQLDLL